MTMTTATDTILTEYLKSTRTTINTETHYNTTYKGPTGTGKAE